MRWPFGHRSTPPDGAPAKATIAPVVPPPARPHDAWRSVSVVQRAIGDPPVVAPARPFADSLATRQAPIRALAVLGPEVSPLASPGLVVGVATSLGATVSGPVDLPVQRLAEGSAEMGEAISWSSFDEPGHSPGLARAQVVSFGGPAEGPGTAGPSEGDAADSTGAVMIQRLASSAPILTTAATTILPATPAGRLDLGPITPRRTIEPSSAGPVGEVVPARAFEDAPAAKPEPPTRRPTLGQARRLGLGAPLNPGGGPLNPGGGPLNPGGGPLVQRSIEAPAGRLGFGGLPPEPAARPLPTMIPSGSGPEAPGDAMQPADLVETDRPTELEVVRAISIQRLVASRSMATTGASPGAGADPMPAAPLLGKPQVARVAATGRNNDVASSEFEEESPERVAPESQSGEQWAPMPLAPLGGGLIRVSSAGSLITPEPTTRAGLGGRAAVSGGSAGEAPVIARAVADPGQPARRPAATGGIANPAPLPAGPLRRSADPDGGRRVIEFAVPPSDQAGETATAQSGSSAVPVQRAVLIEELQVQVPSQGATPGASPGTGAAPGAGSSGGQGASPVDHDHELDELARRLYGRIRSRLSAELLADRERAGLITDLR